MSDVSRRKFLGQVARAAVAGAVASALNNSALGDPTGGSTPPTTDKPNVLFIMSDDMRVELGCYASEFGAQTPNLDKLAASGVRFDRNFCQFPLCNPSRASLLTGRRATKTSVLGNRTNFRVAHPDWTTLPQLFKDNGYVTIRAGKIYHGGIDDPKSWSATSDRGGATDDGGGNQIGKTMVIPRVQIPMPDGILPPLPADTGRAAYSDRIVVLNGNGEGHGDYLTADRTIANLQKYQDRPFFIACGFVKPHSPPTAPQRFLDLYDPQKIKLTPDFAAWPTVPPGFPSAAIRKRNADLFIGRGASESEARQVIRAYLASISWVDWNIGRVLAELDRLNLRQKTIIVFVADHGYQLGEKGKWSKAGSLFEMGTRVPMMICAPSAKGNGQSCTRTVQSLDIYPTLVDLCGLPRQPDLEGVPLTDLLANPAGNWDQPAYSVWSEDGASLHGVAIRTEDWRYAEFGPAASNGAMLFDSRHDPMELTNLADNPKHAAIRARLSPLVRQYAASLA